VNKLDITITKHVNDVIQKHANALFKDATLDFYGIKTAPIKELINPELPTVEVSSGAADIVFLLEDDTYLHFAFETGHNSMGAMLKCAGYDLRLFERDKRLIHSVVIYTKDVKNKPTGFEIGSLVYNPGVILMNDYDGNAIYTALEVKIKAGQDLTDVDMLNLVLLPLMNHTIPRRELAANSIMLAQTIADPTKRNACIAAAFAFACKYLDETDINELLEVLKMTDIGTLLVMDRNIEIAKKLLKRGTIVNVIDVIMEDIGLDESTVQRLKDELNN